MRQELNNLIKATVRQIQKEKIWPDFTIPEFQTEHPENKIFGDYSTNAAMVLAKIVKKNPMDIADLLVKKIQDTKYKIQDTKPAAPGFINFTLSESYLQEQVKKILKQGDKFGQLKIGRGKKVQVEFISANPTGPLTVGNARGGPLGDVLANVLKKAGFKAERAYYVNDYGRQILTLGHSVLKDKGARLPDGQAKYKGPYIDALSERIKEKDPEKAGQKAAKIILKEMIKKTTDRLRIKFDQWFSEQELYNSGRVDKVLKTLKKKNLIYEKDGALWFKSSKFGDEKDRVVIKANGFKTYLAGDIAWHQYKFQEKEFDKVVDIWGADHAGDILRLRGAMEALGHKNKLEIILLQFVSLIDKGQGLKMSKRAGIYVTMDELLDKVGVDAVRFFFLQKSPGAHLNFDLSLAEEQSEKNPVYYVQYAHARICSILWKSLSVIASEAPHQNLLVRGEAKQSRGKQNSATGLPRGFDPRNDTYTLLTHLSELNLIRQLIRFPEVIEDTAKDYQVQRLPFYALDLARAFHKFYKDCRVISDDKTLTQSRLALVRATQIILKNTLGIIGIKALTKMLH